LPINWAILSNNDLNVSASLEHNKTDDIHFMDDKEEEYINLIEESNAKSQKIEKIEYDFDFNEI
jgi:hypothetical protein